jgi:hypothetical protein
MASTENPIVPAAAAVEEKKTPAEEKTGAKEGAVREAAHAAADIEADATIKVAKLEAEIEKLKGEIGERAATKLLEQRLTEIKTEAGGKLESLKSWLEERLNAIEGKKKEPATGTEQKSSEPPAGVASAASSETSKTKRRRI